MGSPKALLEFRGRDFFGSADRNFRRLCAPVVVVLGGEAERIRAGLQHPERVVFAENQRLPSRPALLHAVRLAHDPADSRRRAVHAGGSSQRAVLHVRALLEAPLAPLAIPRFAGRRGHPIFFRGNSAEFLALDRFQAKSVVNSHAAQARFVDVDDAGIRDDVDDPAAYRRLIETA